MAPLSIPNCLKRNHQYTKFHSRISFQAIMSYLVEMKFWSLNNSDLDLEPTCPSQTWPVSCNDTSVFQKIIKSMKYLKNYHPETIFLFLVTVTLTLNPQDPKSNLICILWCYIYVPKRDYICKVFHELSSGNHFSIFSNTDLDIEPTRPKVELNLHLVMLHLCTKFFLNIRLLSGVIVRKAFFYF